MEDSSMSSLDLSCSEKTKQVDDIIPVPEEETSSSLGSIPSLIKDADNYVRGIFSGFKSTSTDDECSTTAEKDDEEDEEEEEKEPLLDSLKNSFKNLFDKRGIAILALIFLLGCLIYMYKNGHLANIAKMLPMSYLTGESHEHHDHHEHGHEGCTCKNKGEKPANNDGPAGECPCQRAKRLAEEAAKQKAAEFVNENHHIFDA